MTRNGSFIHPPWERSRGTSGEGIRRWKFARGGVILWFCLVQGFTVQRFGASPLAAAPPLRCEVMPLPGRQASFMIAGKEQLRWHFDDQAPRPFFYPLNGPAGVSLTRMGHPGAPNHDHHRSLWFAHHDVNGLDFWSDNSATKIRQKSWYVYEDGEVECRMACLLGWYDKQGREVMEQDVVVELLPLADGEYGLELQLNFRCATSQAKVTLGRTNFGFLALRVAKSLSAHFGGGEISSSEGARGEVMIFGKRARWMDYSGPIAVGSGVSRSTVVEGITYFDHPTNIRYPSFWHVREDGWMGASFCFDAPFELVADQTLTLRYLLHVHAGSYRADQAACVHASFAARGPLQIQKSSRKHRQYEIRRQD